MTWGAELLGSRHVSPVTLETICGNPFLSVKAQRAHGVTNDIPCSFFIHSWCLLTRFHGKTDNMVWREMSRQNGFSF